MDSYPPTETPDQQYPPQQPVYQYIPSPGQYPPVTMVTQQPAPYAQPASHTTVVVTQQPMAMQKITRDWSTGLCGCFEDCGSLFMGLCCPCKLLTGVSYRMNEGCCFPCCCPGALLGLRIKMRVQENIEGSLMNDYCVVEFCPLCVLCQLSRELDHVART